MLRDDLSCTFPPRKMEQDISFFSARVLCPRWTRMRTRPKQPPVRKKSQPVLGRACQPCRDLILLHNAGLHATSSFLLANGHVAWRVKPLSSRFCLCAPPPIVVPHSSHPPLAPMCPARSLHERKRRKGRVRITARALTAAVTICPCPMWSGPVLRSHAIYQHLLYIVSLVPTGRSAEMLGYFTRLPIVEGDVRAL